MTQKASDVGELAGDTERKVKEFYNMMPDVADMERRLDIMVQVALYLTNRTDLLKDMCTPWGMGKRRLAYRHQQQVANHQKAALGHRVVLVGSD